MGLEMSDEDRIISASTTVPAEYVGTASSMQGPVLEVELKYHRSSFGNRPTNVGAR
jgi:hypothetical protein